MSVNIPCNLSEKKITAIRCSTMTVALKFTANVVVGSKLENSKAEAGILGYNAFLARNIADSHSSYVTSGAEGFDLVILFNISLRLC